MSFAEDEFSIKPHDVLTAQEALTTVTRKIEDSLKNIEANAGIVLGGWEGEAQEAFRAKQARWNEDAAEIQRRLVQLVHGLEQAVISYVRADRAGVGIITGQ